MKYQNPVLRGMYPDPSVCRADGKYYMVCSTFEYFPGVPLFESDDMINWRQIGHCLTRESQLPLSHAGSNGGIYAPTIRYNNGRFYMVTTNTSGIQNFFVYTDNIYGEWSEPISVEQDGIDPSLYFENDRTYFISNGNDENSRPCIRMCEIDINTGKSLSESKPLWYGTGGRYIEAPHLYKFGEYYYLLDAEGGTEYGHTANYARSKSLWGPFEPFMNNPALTNRNLGGYVLQGTGHGDIIEDYNGNWWFMHLAFRQIDKWEPFHHLGRECCLVPVTWKDNWFYIGDGTAKLEYELPNINAKEQQLSFEKNFLNLDKNKDWCFLRNYVESNYEFGTDYLKLTGTKDTIFGLEKPSFAAIRQSEFKMSISCCVESSCKEAGISIYYDERHHYDFFIDDRGNAVLRLNIGCISHVAKIQPIKGKQIQLNISADEHCYNFSVISDSETIDMGYAETKYLSSEVACGFTGVMIGLYAVDDLNRSAIFNNLKLSHSENK